MPHLISCLVPEVTRCPNSITVEPLVLRDCAVANFLSVVLDPGLCTEATFANPDSDARVTARFQALRLAAPQRRNAFCHSTKVGGREGVWPTGLWRCGLTFELTGLLRWVA